MNERRDKGRNEDFSHLKNPKLFKRVGMNERRDKCIIKKVPQKEY